MNKGLLCGVSGVNSPSRYVADVGDGASYTLTVNHGLGTQDVGVAVRRNTSPFDLVFPDVQAVDPSRLTLAFAMIPTVGQFRVVVSRL